MKNEYYNLYIDADEEVTTIISRLSLARAQNVVLIVPQHSLVLQSIINLRLLAREAKKQRKKIMIVTQDIDGIAFAGRVGIPAIPLQEWKEKTQEDDIVITNDQFDNVDTPQTTSVLEENANGSAATQIPPKYPARVQGSMDMARQRPSTHTQSRPQQKAASVAPQKVQWRERMIDHVKEEIKQPESESPKYNKKTSLPEKHPRAISHPEINAQDSSVMHSKKLPREAQKKREYNTKIEKEYKESLTEEAPVVKKIHRFGWFLIFASTIGVIAFLLLPLSTVTVRLGDASTSERMAITARTSNTEVNTERKMIPLRLLEKQITRTVSIPATGTKDLDASKAYGTITIFNELSEKPQSLVATTRFQAEDGTIFRIQKNTTVPGTKKSDGEVIPGEVTVSVVADKSGPESNVPAGKWTIPGFKNNPQKYNAFYATSATQMTGGSVGGKDSTVVTKDDLDKVQSQAQADIEEYFASQLKDLVREQEVLLPDAISYDISRSESTQQEDTPSDEASYIITADVKALIFSESDLLSIIKNGPEGLENISRNEINYDTINTDFKDEKIDLKLSMDLKRESTIDKDKFQDALRGKKHSEIKEILKEKYPYVNDISIKTYPPFPSSIGDRFSRYKWMTRITTEESTKNE